MAICLVDFSFLFLALGTPALTSRGFVEEDFVKVAEFFDAAVCVAVKIKAETKGDRMILMAHYLATLERECISMRLVSFFSTEERDKHGDRKPEIFFGFLEIERCWFFSH